MHSPHPTRDRILEEVEADPGQSLKELTEALALNRGTLRYHLQVLEKEQRVNSLADQRTTRFFPATMDSRQAAQIGALRRGRVTELVTEVSNNPNQSQFQLLTKLGMSRKVLRAYVEHLTSHGLLAEEGTLRKRVYRLRASVGPVVREFLARLPSNRRRI